MSTTTRTLRHMYRPKAFASEVADAEGGDELPHHTATKIIGEVLAEIDSREDVGG